METPDFERRSLATYGWPLAGSPRCQEESLRHSEFVNREVAHNLPLWVNPIRACQCRRIVDGRSYPHNAGIHGQAIRVRIRLIPTLEFIPLAWVNTEPG
jgi:hypothetical protein